TLLAIALRYGVSLDELLKANIDVLDPSNPDFVPANVLLTIPPAEVATGSDCSQQPAQTRVITYTVRHGEGLFCLARKFNLSITTLLDANPHLMGEDVIENGALLTVPPVDGAVYTITAEDVSYGVRLQHLLQWYSVTKFEDIVDWNGNPVSPTLQEGQALFIRGADLLAGPFQAPIILAAQATPAPVRAADNAGATSNSASAEANAETVPGVENSAAAALAPAVGPPPAGALRPPNNPWIGTISEFDTGYCGDIVDGHGWTGSLSWPVNSRSIGDDRHFRPGHTGIDIDVDVGTPVYAAEAGVVIWNGFSKWGGGIMVTLAHGDTWQSYYAHMSSVATQCGARVARGDLIGYSGQSGMASWPHLHFEVRHGGFSYDPATWLP
ncbi:MAG TPA: peptidoglycan DD-metalloendopeptidase family protein, partial [Anaerolineae bacterium]